MGYSISVSLKPDAPCGFLEEVLKQSKFIKNNASIHISQNPTEHGYSVPYDKGLYISFTSLTLSENYFVHSFFKLIASLYGQKILSPKHKKEYPFYNYDKEITLIVPESEYLENRAEFEDYQSYKDDILSAEEIDKIYEKLKDKDKCENNIDVKYFNFGYISRTPYKIKYVLPDFIANFITNDNKVFIEVFENIKILEKEFKNEI